MRNNEVRSSPTTDIIAGEGAGLPAMWTHREFVAYGFPFAVTVAGLGIVALAFG